MHLIWQTCGHQIKPLICLKKVSGIHVYNNKWNHNAVHDSGGGNAGLFFSMSNRGCGTFGLKAEMEVHTQYDNLHWTWTHATLLGVRQQKHPVSVHWKIPSYMYFFSGSVRCSFVPSSMSKPCWRSQHFHRVPQHQPLHSHEVRGEAEVLTTPQNQNWATSYWYVNTQHLWDAFFLFVFLKMPFGSPLISHLVVTNSSWV